MHCHIVTHTPSHYETTIKQFQTRQFNECFIVKFKGFERKKETHAKKSTQKKFTWFLVLTTVDSHSKETLPEAQRTQAIKSKTWNISGAKIITNSSFNSFSRAVKMHCAGTATRCCQSPEHIAIKYTKLWTLHAHAGDNDIWVFQKMATRWRYYCWKTKTELLWLKTHRIQSNMSTQEKNNCEFSWI